MSELPKGGSVWGHPDCTATWVRVKNVGDMVQVSNFEGYVQYFDPKSHIFPPAGYVRIDSDITEVVNGGESADDVWNEVVEALQAAWPNETLHWNESPRELITRLINERDERTAKLEFLRSKGLTVGTMQESGKDPYLAYVIEPGSELCDLESVNKLVDAEVRANKYEVELERCAAIVQRVYLGGVSGIGLLNVADAMQDIFADKIPKRTDTAGRDVTELPGLWSEDDTITGLSQPFTVEWLCEIGGKVAEACGECVVVFADDEGLTYDVVRECWFYRGSPINVQPKTRGDVLKWLDMLGIVPKVTPVT